MENQKNVVTNQNQENTEKKTKTVNPVIVKTKLINAQMSSTGQKIGVFLMLFDGQDAETGFCNIQAYCGSEITNFDKESQKVFRSTLSPIVSKWFDIDDSIIALTRQKAFSDVFAVVSGKGNFMQLHRILTEAEFKQYQKLVALI